MHPYVHCSIIYNSQDMPATQVPINTQVDKKVVIHIYIYYSAVKKYEILSFASARIDLEGIMLSEVSQTEKDKYHVISFIVYVESKEQNK